MHNYKYIDIQLLNTYPSEQLAVHNCLCVVTSDLEPLMQNREKFLHPTELKFLATMQYPRRQISYLRGRYAAKLALQRLEPHLELWSIGIQNGVFGFPYICPALAINNQISISHNDISAFAIAFDQSHPMGVDVEQISSDRVETIRSQMLANELDLALNGMADESIALTIFWTAKEALSKIIKCGLWIDYKLLEINVFEINYNTLVKNNSYVCKFKNFPQYKTQSFIYQDNICSIVLPSKSTYFSRM